MSSLGRPFSTVTPVSMSLVHKMLLLCYSSQYFVIFCSRLVQQVIHHTVPSLLCAHAYIRDVPHVLLLYRNTSNTKHTRIQNKKRNDETARHKHRGCNHDARAYAYALVSPTEQSRREIHNFHRMKLRCGSILIVATLPVHNR